MSRHRKRIMRAFRIDEVSLVDAPAQEDAITGIVKRMEPTMPNIVIRKSGPEPQVPQDFNAAVAAIRNRDRCSRLDAMRKAHAEHPALFAKYQSDGAVSSRPVEKAASKPRAVEEWERLVEPQRNGGKVSRTEAMRLARRLHPDEFERYQNA